MKKKKEKGFIQILLLVVAIASIAGVSFVLHKQEKLVSNNTNTASIFEAMEQIKQNEKVTNTENEEVKEELQNGQKPTLETKPKKEEVISQGIDENEIVQWEGQKITEEAEPELEIKTIREEATEPEFIPEVEEPNPDPCADIVCPDCQYCLNSNCIARPDGYNDCGSGCQRCVNGSCQDSDDVCSNCQYCDFDVCIDNCKGTDASCGCNTCLNCNKSDGWVDIDFPYSCCDEDNAMVCFCQKQEYRNCSCLDNSCVCPAAKTRINQSDCEPCDLFESCINGSCHIDEKAKDKIIFEKVESDVDYYTGQINLMTGEINQIANSYRVALDACGIDYLNQINSAESIYKPEMERLHKEICNEATKGLWTNCIWLREFWDFQNSYYGQYSTTLTNAERTLNNDIDRVAIKHFPNINHYQNIINNHKIWLQGLSEKLNALSVSDKKSLQNDITNLEKKLDSLVSELNEIKNYSVSYHTPASKLSLVENLMKIEKNYFSETSCGNLPR